MKAEAKLPWRPVERLCLCCRALAIVGRLRSLSYLSPASLLRLLSQLSFLLLSFLCLFLFILCLKEKHFVVWGAASTHSL
ncbi:hypothetical protein BJX99DRAFT_242198 [Aspergillus californicus]